jgi:ribosomal protein S18 acetylase RimI-like enzyme
MKINVVELKSENAQEYLELRKVSEIELPQYVGPSAERELMSSNEGIAKIVASYESEGTILFGAFSEEKLVGVIAISRRLSQKFKHRAFIWGMYISNEFRQLKVGALLLAHVQSWAKNHQEVNVLWLQVTESNTPAVSFYKKHGFEIYGTEPQALFTQGEYHNVHYMQTSA